MRLLHVATGGGKLVSNGGGGLQLERVEAELVFHQDQQCQPHLTMPFAPAERLAHSRKLSS